MGECCCDHEERLLYLECQNKVLRNAIFWLQQHIGKKKMVKKYGNLTTIKVKSQYVTSLRLDKTKQVAFVGDYHGTLKGSVDLAKSKSFTAAGAWTGTPVGRVPLSKSKRLAIAGDWSGTNYSAIAFAKSKSLALSGAFRGTYRGDVSLAKSKSLVFSATHNIPNVGTIPLGKSKLLFVSGVYTPAPAAVINLNKSKSFDVAITGAFSQKRFAGTGAVLFGGGGIVWNNPGNAVGNQTTINADATDTASSSTEFLLMTNYGFSIPPGATIRGYQLDLVCQDASDGDGSIGDVAIQIYKAGIIGANQATPGQWSTSQNDRVYGGPADLWSVGLTPAQVGDVDFGIVVEVAGMPDSGTGSWQADVFSAGITIFYTI